MLYALPIFFTFHLIMLLMFGEGYHFQHFLLSIFHQAAVSEYVDISYTNQFSHITAHESPEEE